MSTYASVSNLASEIPAARIGVSGSNWTEPEAIAILREETARILGRLAGAGIDAGAVAPLYDTSASSFEATLEPVGSRYSFEPGIGALSPSVDGIDYLTWTPSPRRLDIGTSLTLESIEAFDPDDQSSLERVSISSGSATFTQDITRAGDDGSRDAVLRFFQSASATAPYEFAIVVSDGDLSSAQLLLRRICRMAAAARIYYALPTDSSYERAQDLEREARLSVERFIAEPGSLGVRSSVQILNADTETT